MRDCFRLLGRAGTAAAALALTVTATALAGPGLPRTYDFVRVTSPEPIAGGSFGWGIASADLTKDGRADLLVAQAQTGKGQIFIHDGATGAHIDTINPPEQNPPTANGPANNETLAFVYVETMPDIGSCPSGDGADAGRICDDALVGAGDGVPEIIAGSRNLKVNADTGSQAPVAADRNIGRAYVFDGATRAVLKRIDMPQADRVAQAALNAAPQFGRLIMSLQGMAPCAGSSAENNAVGVGACPDVPKAVRIGDVNGGGEPDLVVTARNYLETRDQAAVGSQCRASTANTCTSGKAYVYPGEAIAGSDPQVILETPLYSMQNPESQTGGAEFGGNVFRVGDVWGPTGNSNPPDGRPDFVVAARNLDYPLKAPDASVWPNVGAAFLFSGSNGALARTIPSPEPQARSQFSGSFNSGRALGDLGASGTSDILLPAPLQNVTAADDGRAWVFNGEQGNLAGGGGEGSWQFATLTDPTPMIGGNFGGATTGVGDLVSTGAAPANEVLVGGFNFDPATEASNNNVADLHILNATTQQNLQTIPHPEGARGDGFGVGLAPMGDLNGDGFLDIAASAYLANVTLAGEGLAYILSSNNTPLPAQPTPTPTATPTPTPTPQARRELAPGPCANEVSGTEAGERMGGTLAGDEIHALGGDDVVLGFQGEDCLDGGTGADDLNGGGDSDQLVGGGGEDRLRGFDGHDRLFGGAAGDVLRGDFGRDMLAGGSGNDTLDGGPDGDRLFGEGGRDRLVAGDGRNFLDGGRGRDVIKARNGERDTIRCGPGRDTAFVDRRDSVNGCERVRRGAG